MAIIFVLWIACAVICAGVASSKGRSGVGWFFLGLLLGLIGVVIVLCLPPLNDQVVHHYHHEPLHSQPTAAVPRLTAAKTSKQTKFCPDCAEEVLAEARICKHCRHQFSDIGVPAVGRS